MRLNPKRKGLYHSSSGLHHYMTKTISKLNSIRKRILGLNCSDFCLEKGMNLRTLIRRKLFPRFFRRPTEFGIIFFPSPGVVFFAATILVYVFFCRPCQKMLHVKVASHFFRQSSKVTLSNKKILQASPYHLPSDCFVGNLHKNWQAVNKKGLKRKTTTLGRTQ